MAWKANKQSPSGVPNRRLSRPSPGGGIPRTTPSKSTPSKGTPVKGTPKKAEPTVKVIAEIEKQRENRRKAMAAAKKERRDENMLNEKMGKPGDVDFQRMITDYRAENGKFARSRAAPGKTNITICVRKRPVNKKEKKRKDYDAVTCVNPIAVVHECKLKVDGITKYLDNNEFTFDHSFDEESTNDDVYQYTVQSLIEFVFEKNGRATVFAYGQTGSGKTHTMEGVQRSAAEDIFKEASQAQQRGLDLEIWVSFFEIYGGRCQDLLHDRKRLTVREDGKGAVQLAGLEDCNAKTVQELLNLIEKGNSIRTTRATEVNDTSSRSHGICQISIRNAKTSALHGKLSLIDLAGSERGTDTKNHNRQRRMESANINTSLLALKECIRALDSKGRNHVPFRASKLTLVLKDSFVNTNARTVMIATVSPNSSSTHHTVNTLRYADRVKENRGGLNMIKDHWKEPVMNPMDIQPLDTEPPAAPMQVPMHSMPPPVPTDVKESVPETSAFMEETEEKNLRDSFSSQKDIQMLHTSLRKQFKDEDRLYPDEDNLNIEQFHGTVQNLYEEEETLLNHHVEVLKENAQMLTEEGGLLGTIQGDDVIDYDIDSYCTRLDEICVRKMKMITGLQSRLKDFRTRLQEEEMQSQAIGELPSY